jgi:hypothetical protein
VRSGKPNRSHRQQPRKSAIHGVIIGITLALSVRTLSKMSSNENLGGAFPIVCERCGQQAAMPKTAPTPGDDHTPHYAVWCAVCNHSWIVPAPNGPITLRRKPDRRATSREE